MSKSKSLNSKLFFSYMILIACVIFVFLFVFYFYLSGILTKSTDELQKKEVLNLKIQAENEIEKMNALHKRFLFSKNSKDLIFQEFSESPEKHVMLNRQFTDSLVLISGPDDLLKYQMYIYNINGNKAGMGYNTFVNKIPEETMQKDQVLLEAIKLDGKKLITAPKRTSWAGSEKIVISLYRSFSKSNTLIPTGILETQIDYETIDEIVNQHVSFFDGYVNNVIIYNDSNEIIFPFEGKVSLTNYLDRQKDSSICEVIGNDGDKEIVAYDYSKFLGWHFLTIQKKSVAYRPITLLRISIYAIGLVSILVTVILNYWMAKKLTSPINKIHKRIKSLDFDELGEGAMYDLNCDIIEIEDLNIGLNEMCLKLRNSLDEVVSLKAHEIQAELKALQAQMNPHFLYNTLSTIQIIAKDEGNKKVVLMCSDLAKMLRYTVRDNDKKCTLSQEIDYLQSYMNLVHIRFGDKLTYSIDIPDSMLDIEIANLMIQPLIENSLRFVATDYPPWIIKITGKQTLNGWRISIEDNGPGFAEEKKREILERFEAHRSPYDVLTYGIGGMGIMNVYVRLKLMYKDKMFFNIKASSLGGAKVELGVDYE